MSTTGKEMEKGICSTSSSAGGGIWDLLAIVAILAVVTVGALPLLTSGERWQLNDDFLSFPTRHEAVRKSLLEHHQFPLRLHWFGGGYPSLGHPEDPALNPLVLLSLVFGAVRGVKLIGFLAIAAGGVGAYALARCGLRYTRWGALYCGLVFGTSLFVPVRIQSGNYNEVYAAFFPLCLLLLAWACRGKIACLLALVFIFFTMLSDGKLTCLTVMLFLGLLCLLNLVPAFRLFGREPAGLRDSVRPLKLLLLALAVTFLVGMVRILPVFEVLDAAGGLLDLRYSDNSLAGQAYLGLRGTPKGFDLSYLLPRLVGHQYLTCYTVGWLPLILFGVALAAFWRESLPWAIVLVFFGWLFMGDKAPYDLFEALRGFPYFNAVRWQDKYFGMPIAYAILIGSGRSFQLLHGLRPRWAEHAIAGLLIALAVGFQFPWMTWLLDNYTYPPLTDLPPPGEFYQIKGQDLYRNRVEPWGAQMYPNLLMNIGTIDFQTNIFIGERAIPKFFIDKSNRRIANPAYRGESFCLAPGNSANAEIHPNSVLIEADLKTPDTLVVNQNYHPAWRTDRGELSAWQGLLAVRLADPGRYTIRLNYHPPRFYQGLAISCASLAALLSYCWLYRTQRLRRWARRAPLPLRAFSAAALWLVDGQQDRGSGPAGGADAIPPPAPAGTEDHISLGP